MFSRPRIYRSHLTLNHLEPRDVPAGTVNAVLAGTTLTLTGDDDDNSVQLVQSGGNIQVIGFNGTTITGASPFAGVGSVKTFMRDGNDNVFIDSGVDFVLTGAASFDLGDGDNNLSLVTAEKISLGSLTFISGDGQDTATVEGGPLKGSSIAGNVVASLGIGRNSQEPPYLDSMIWFRRIDVLGSGGLKMTAGEGDEELTLDTVNVSAALNASGGDGALRVVTTASTIGSVLLNSFGPATGYSTNGTWLASTNTTVSSAMTLKSNSGVNLEFNGGSTGNISITNGAKSDSTATFLGSVTVNGNLTVKGGRHTVTADDGSGVSVNGNVSITANRYASLTASDGWLNAKSITLKGTGGSDLNVYDDGSTPLVAGIFSQGSLTLRGGSVQWYQPNGKVNVDGNLSLIGVNDTSVYSGTGYFGIGPIAFSEVIGSTLFQGKNVSFFQTESEARFLGGLTLKAGNHAEFYSAPWELPAHVNWPSYPPFGNGATTTVAGDAFLMNGNTVFYSQTEGVTTIDRGLVLKGLESATVEAYAKQYGVDENELDDYGIGAKINVLDGPLTMQGESVAYYQEEGEATFTKGINLKAQSSASWYTEAGYNAAPFGTKLSVPNGGILIQGGSADYTQNDGTATVTGDVTVKGSDGAGFGLAWYDAAVGARMTVVGSIAVDAGAGDVGFDNSGDSLQVSGDVKVKGQGLSRSYFGATTGTNVGGSVSISGATGYHDHVGVSSNLTVGGDMSIALGNGTNSIEIGVDGGSTQLIGNLNLNTGNGSDIVALSSITVGGDTLVNTGAGTDRLHLLKDSIFNGSVTGDLGGGADLFEAGLPLFDFQNNLEVPAGPVTFNGAASVKLGTGNDVVRLGIALDPDGRVLFGAGGSLKIDGGANLNLFDNEAGQFDPAKVTDIGFTDPTPP